MTEQKTQKTLIYCSLFLQAGQGSGFPLSLLLAGDKQFIFLQAIHQGREASVKAKKIDTTKEVKTTHHLTEYPLG